MASVLVTREGEDVVVRIVDGHKVTVTLTFDASGTAIIDLRDDLTHALRQREPVAS
ncbi:hypothetical protein [Nocardioides sp.]|uniref:hypothetical protein n=1 Tax=Nocardioides sp. TaxID=35761 RepID=UPI002C6AFBE8|nr:hypothetical protein [Nocardioides sp.]HXH79536.1 hypothetical protein [Nocardioides sp.]